MTIYPHKNDAGALTGRWRVEKQGRVNGKKVRLKATVDTIDEARRKEREFEGQLGLAPVAPTLPAQAVQPVAPVRPVTGAPTTVVELLEVGKRALWGGASSMHYENSVRHVTRAAGVIGDTPLSQLRTTDIDKVADYLKGRGLKAGTVNRNLSALHTLLEWGMEREWGPNRMPNFAWQVEPEYTLRLLEGDEDLRILEYLRAYKGDAASVLLAGEVADYIDVDLVVGMRRGELLSRKPEHLYQAKDAQGKVRWWLRVTQTKGKRERSAPLTAEHAAILRRRLPWTLKTHNIRHYFNKARDALGLADHRDELGNRRVVLHAIRHTVGTRMVDAGVDLIDVKDALGHADVKTTLRYVHRNNNRLSSAQDKMLAFTKDQRRKS